MNSDKSCNWKFSDGCLEIIVDADVYPKEPLLATCCVFIDDCYILLDLLKGKKKYKVKLWFKPELTGKIDIKDLPGEFYNELLNNTLRYEISSRNRVIRECIVREALFFTQPKEVQEKFIQCACEKGNDGEDKN